ncbi:MAG: hypothetical protein AAGA56_12350, partial [Myxococcota bacterium]
RQQRNPSLSKWLAAALSLWVERLGSEASSWGRVAYPLGEAFRLQLGVGALAASVAAVRLRRPGLRAARAAAVLAVLLALLHVGAPGPEHAPATRWWYLTRREAAYPLPIGYLGWSVIDGWPVAGAALALLGWPRSDRAVVVVATTFPFLVAGAALARPSAALFLILGEGLIAGVMLILLAASIAQVAFFGIEEPTPDRRFLAVTTAVALSVAAIQAGLARPPDKGVYWPLTQDVPARLLPLYKTLALRAHGPRSARRDMTDLPPRLAPAITDLDAVIGDPNATSRDWYRAVADVNAVHRELGLPVYLDPRIELQLSPEGVRRRVEIAPYRVARAPRYRGGNGDYTALRLRGLTETQAASHRFGLLGFSRDQQPYALIVLEAVDAYALDLARWGSATPPRCGTAYEPDADRALRRCGSMLAALADASWSELALREVERHEIQHQIDGPNLPLALPLVFDAGTEEQRHRISRELSAYFAQLMVSELPRVALTVPLRFAALGGRTEVYHEAAVLMFEALGTSASVRTTDGIDAAALADTYDELVSISDAELRARSRAAYQRMFRRELAEVGLE